MTGAEAVEVEVEEVRPSATPSSEATATEGLAADSPTKEVEEAEEAVEEVAVEVVDSVTVTGAEDVVAEAVECATPSKRASATEDLIADSLTIRKIISYILQALLLNLMASH